MKITAVLMMKQIEKSLPFWVDRLGFEVAVEVPDGDGIGFTLLVRDGAELMLQTLESVKKDTPQFVPSGQADDVGLFIEVDNFGETVRRLEGYPIAMAERVSSYGMREIGIREPNGRVVIFAARANG